MFYFFGPISPDFLLFFPTDNSAKAEIAGTGTDRRLDRSLTLADGARRPRHLCGPVASPPRERGGRAVPAVPGPPEPLGRGEHVVRAVLIAPPLRAALATLWGRSSSAGHHVVPNAPILPNKAHLGTTKQLYIFRYFFWHLLYNTIYSDAYPHTNPVYSIQLCPGLSDCS